MHKKTRALLKSLEANNISFMVTWNTDSSVKHPLKEGIPHSEQTRPVDLVHIGKVIVHGPSMKKKEPYGQAEDFVSEDKSGCTVDLEGLLAYIKIKGTGATLSTPFADQKINPREQNTLAESRLTPL